LQLSDIIVHENYKGRKLHFSSDIALLKLNVSVELTWAVLPVCVDWRNEYERFQLSNGFLGTVSFSFEILGHVIVNVHTEKNTKPHSNHYRIHICACRLS